MNTGNEILRWALRRVSGKPQWSAVHRRDGFSLHTRCKRPIPRHAIGMESAEMITWDARRCKRCAVPRTEYKVWIEIEEYNLDTADGQTVDAPGSAVATFATYDDAYAFAARMQQHGETLAEREY